MLENQRTAHCIRQYSSAVSVGLNIWKSSEILADSAKNANLYQTTPEIVRAQLSNDAAILVGEVLTSFYNDFLCLLKHLVILSCKEFCSEFSVRWETMCFCCSVTDRELHLQPVEQGSETLRSEREQVVRVRRRQVDRCGFHLSARESTQFTHSEQRKQW